jgi:hypothetical protein
MNGWMEELLLCSLGEFFGTTGVRLEEGTAMQEEASLLA